jgi:hypothetical protein
MSTKKLLYTKLNALRLLVDESFVNVNDIQEIVDEIFDSLYEVHQALAAATLIDKSDLCKNAVLKLDTILID